jgi:PKD repeat protein
MKRFLTILPLLSLIVISCNREPFAEATVDINNPYVGEYVRFTSYSTNTDYVEWDMDDGVMYSTPVVDHYFVDPGPYDVTLRAFGTKGGVSTAMIPMDVIGAELTVVVTLYDNEALLPGASVLLYPTLTDWDEQTNAVLNPVDGTVYELFTDSYGECTFEGLSYQNYYVDVWEANYNNWDLGSQDEGWIETPMLEGAFYWTFEAVVTYDPSRKKSAATERPRRSLKAASARENRAHPELVTKVPRKRK